MLSETEVQALICVRVGVCAGCCNGFTIKHIDGQLRALLAVLTEKIPPTIDGNTEAIFRLAGIKCYVEGKKVMIPDDEMRRLGFLNDDFKRKQDDKECFGPW